MQKRPTSLRILRLASLSLAALCALTFIASCSSGSGDPAPAAPATLDDFIGDWLDIRDPETEKPTEILLIDQEEDSPGIGVFLHLTGDMEGLVTVSNGTATLTTTLSATYDEITDTIFLPLEPGAPPAPMARVSGIGHGTPGTIAGDWSVAMGEDIITLTIVMSSESSGTFTSATNGAPTYSGSCSFDTGVITFVMTYGTAVLNASKDTMTLSLTGSSALATLYKFTPPPAPED